jgi:hypothetical protein
VGRRERNELFGHSITPGEVYEIWENGPVWVPNIHHHAGDWKMIGRTNGGRPLTIVIRFYPDRATLRPITGWRTTTSERSKYGEGS